jgi:tetratricopeptide (TPR) repeat protein
MKYSQLFYLLKKYDTATVFINRCLHFNNTSPVAHFQKGMILKEWGDTAKAISSFQTAVSYDQKYYDAYMQLGVLLSVKKNLLALDYLNNALSIDPKSAEALYAKGLFFQRMGKPDEAVSVYNSILKFSPENQNATYNLGTILFEQKKINEAMEKFQATVTRDQNFFRGYYGLGRCYEANGQTQQAIDSYKKALALQSDYDLAAIQLDGLLRKGKKK